MTRALLALLLASPAWGHDFYSGYCCSAVGTGMVGDCAPIPESAVRATPEGYLITLTPEDHPRVKATMTRLFRYPDADPSNDRGTIPEAQISPDGRPHACVLPYSQEFRCAYVAPPGS